MSEENILSLEIESPGTEHREAAAGNHSEFSEPWEKILVDGTLRLLNERISPINGGIDQLQEALHVILNSLGSLDLQSTLRTELERITASARAAVAEKSRIVTEQHQQDIERLKAEWESELKVRLEEKAEETRRETSSRIREIEGQLQSSRAALELAVQSEQTPPSSALSATIDHTGLLNEAVNKINSQRSQSDTLSILVEYAAFFAPRVLFFVVRSGFANGWKASGPANNISDETASKISLPVDSSSLVGRALLSSMTVTGDDQVGLMAGITPPAAAGAVAIPLVVRGRSAAALYADSGTNPNSSFEEKALEIIMLVASMAIELLPTRRGEPVPSTTSTQTNPSNTNARGTTPLPRLTPNPESRIAPTPPGRPLTRPESHVEPVIYSPKPSKGRPPGGETRDLQTFSVEYTDPSSNDAPPSLSQPTHHQTEAEALTNQGPGLSEIGQPIVGKYDQPSLGAASVYSPDGPDFEQESPVPSNDVSGQDSTPDHITIGRVTKPVPGHDRSERPATAVTVPPPVPAVNPSESEQRAHNDARRFARLLVSEIKLYNGVKVGEGRRNYDLYSRLSDEIVRSRKVYERRVSPAVAANFDYFYDELVQTLADGDKDKLGVDCPGPQLRA